MDGELKERLLNKKPPNIDELYWEKIVICALSSLENKVIDEFNIEVALWGARVLKPEFGGAVNDVDLILP